MHKEQCESKWIILCDILCTLHFFKFNIQLVAIIKK